MAIDFNSNELSSYEKLGKKFKIRKEITDIKEKLEIISVKEEIEQVSLEDEKKNLQERLDILIEEEKEIANEKLGNLLIIDNYEAIKNIKEKLDKLESKKQAISLVAYNKLKKEYADESKSRQIKIKNELDKISNLNDQLNLFLKTVFELKEELEIRFSLNEYSENEYSNKKEEIQVNEKKAESIIQVFKVLLEEIKIDEL